MGMAWSDPGTSYRGRVTPHSMYMGRNGRQEAAESVERPTFAVDGSGEGAGGSALR